MTVFRIPFVGHQDGVAPLVKILVNEFEDKFHLLMQSLPKSGQKFPFGNKVVDQLTPVNVLRGQLLGAALISLKEEEILIWTYRCAKSFLNIGENKGPLKIHFRNELQYKSIVALRDLAR